jgi:hypothetical protein
MTLDGPSDPPLLDHPALCASATLEEDAVVPYQIPELLTGVILIAALIGAAALVGRLAARLFLRATRPADAPEARH